MKNLAGENMKKILMIGTGGTIASIRTDHGLAPGLTPADILSYIPAVSNVCEVSTLQVCNLDSTNVSPEHWKMMVRAIEDNYYKFDGFVICHGTDTLAYTGLNCNVYLVLATHKYNHELLCA